MLKKEPQNGKIVNFLLKSRPFNQGHEDGGQSFQPGWMQIKKSFSKSQFEQAFQVKVKHYNQSKDLGHQ